jgi:hypothetical protein
MSRRGAIQGGEPQRRGGRRGTQSCWGGGFTMGDDWDLRSTLSRRRVCENTGLGLAIDDRRWRNRRGAVVAEGRGVAGEVEESCWCVRRPRAELYTHFLLSVWRHPARPRGTTDVSRGIHPTVGCWKKIPSRQRRLMRWAPHGMVPALPSARTSPFNRH